MAEKFKKVMIYCADKNVMSFIYYNEDGNLICQKCKDEDFICDYAKEEYKKPLSKEVLEYSEEDFKCEEINLSKK